MLIIWDTLLLGWWSGNLDVSVYDDDIFSLDINTQA